MALRKISPEELQEILRLHGIYVENGVLAGKCAVFSNIDLSGANLRNSYLECATLAGALLSGADLSFASLNGAGAHRANFSGANIQYCSLRDVDLRYANLSGANLQDANIQKVNFQGTDFRGANLNQSIPDSCWIESSKWLRSDVPWWLGHRHQNEIILCDQ
jgi:uncharacterized protein YjbI with pentapeptide repeats